MSKIKQATKKTGRARKEVIVAELVEKIDQTSGLVFADYKGITHKQLEDLKKELKKLDSTIVIAKNSLIRISLGQSKKYADFKDNEGLNLPTATLLINGDMVEPLKKIQKAIKEFGLPKIKFAILEGNLTDEAGVLKIASLPNRETLLAQFVGMLNSPISGLVVTLNGTIQKFVMTLDAVAKTKPAVAAPIATPVADEAPAETIDKPADTAQSDSTVEAVPANEPAETPAAPVETDENIESAEPTTQETTTEETKEEKSEGGEN